eukprot:gene26610-33214_t
MIGRARNNDADLPHLQDPNVIMAFYTFSRCFDSERQNFATIFYIISIYFIVSYFDITVSANYALQLSTVAAVFASCTLMVAVSLDVKNSLQLTIERMAGVRPKVIRRVFHMPTLSSFAARRNSASTDDVNCGWDVDEDRCYKTFVIL